MKAMVAVTNREFLRNAMWKLSCFACCAAAMASTSCMSANQEIDDLAFVSAGVVKIYEYAGNKDVGFAPETPVPASEASRSVMVLKIQFSSKIDFIAFAERTGFNFSSNLYVCKPNKKDKVILRGGYVYWKGFPVESNIEKDLHHTGIVPERLRSQANTYNIYVSIQSKAVKGGPFASPAYDLTKNSQDLCLQLVGGNMVGGVFPWETFVSNTIVIPREQVSIALQKHP